MRIYFYPECNFNINKAKTYDVTSLAEWFDSQHKNPDDYEIVGRDGESHDSAYEADVCAVYPRIMGGKSKGKNILKAVIGLGLLLATGGTTAALFAHYGGINMAHALGAGLLLSGGGALLMGKMKMPSMDLSSDSATKENYQWNVGNLSTSRGVKGVTFGSDVIPEGELLAYRTYGTSTLEKLTRSETYYVNETYKTGRQVWDYASYSYVAQTATRKVAKTRTVDDFYLVKDDSSYLELLIGAGEGELDSITDIRINDISLSDLEMVEDVDYAIRLGSNTQTALKQTNLDSQAGYQSIGQTVPVKLNGSVTPLLITTPADCDSCCIAFQAQNWYLYDTSSGAKNKAYIKPKIGYRLNGSTGAYTYIKTGVKEIDSGLPIKSDSAFYFQTVIKFPSNGTYQISIENDSAELNNTKGLLSAAEYSGSALPDRAAINISVDNIACYNNKEQTYPNTALIWLRIPASQTLNGSMPKVTWKQSRDYIYAYNGSSYVLKPADNLAWAIYDIIAQVRKDGNTYHNEGEDVANIDFDKFVAFAAFCDSIGAKGNWFLNKLDTSWSNAMSVATSCRAFIGLRSGKVCPYWDAPTEMTQIFTVGNYEDMSGVITAKKDRAKAIEATFNNEEEKFASRTVRVEIDNDHSAEAVSMTFAGLSNPVNVSKQAHYILRRNKYLVQSVKFTADIDSIVCELNDVIGIQCDLTEYGVGGRIFKVENNAISLDAPVTLTSGNSYALLVRHTDGTLERKTPVETNGTYTQLTFSSAWSKPVLKGDVYSFGIANSEVRKYRVTGITRTNDLKAQIEAIEYNENVYDELAVAPYTYTNPNAGINNVTTTYTPEAVELAWDANNNTSYVNVYVDGVFYGRYQNGAQIPNINSEQLIEMFPVNEYGEEDTPVVRTISNNLPTPSTPPVPIVQSTTTGCVAEFDGIPKNENIVWLIIKEGDNELGRANILGEYMSVSIQLRSGTHTLSAYFVNQFSKSSQARTFTATPLGDIQANDISATALKLPTGSILRLSAKNCTTASIAEANGVKDVSGNGNHGQAYGGVTVLDGGEGFSFTALGDYIYFNKSNLLNRLNNLAGISINIRLKLNVANKRNDILVSPNNSSHAFFFIATAASVIYGGTAANNTYYDFYWSKSGLEANKIYDFLIVYDYANAKIRLYHDGELDSEHNYGTTGNFTAIPTYIMLSRNINDYLNGQILGFRIYPRALSASEIKTIFMFPDDVTFGQMTADLIGANIIKGTNLYSENIITQAAQINQAVFQSLIVTNGSTVANQVDVGGRNLLRNDGGYGAGGNTTVDNTNHTVTIGTSDTDTWFTIKAATNIVSGKTYTISCNVSGLTSGKSITIGVTKNSSSLKLVINSNGKCVGTGTASVNVSAGGNVVFDDYTRNLGGSNIVLSNFKLEEGNKATTWTPAPEDTDASINAITTNIYSPNTTTINGGKITTGTIQAAAIEANTITASKLNVEALKRPNGAKIILSAKGITTNSSKDSGGVPDISGNARTARNYNGYVAITEDSDLGWCFSFTNNNNGRCIYCDDSTFNPFSGSWTIFAKIKVGSLSPSSYQVICDKGSSTATNGPIFLNWSSTGFYFRVNTSGGTDVIGGANAKPSSTSTVVNLACSYNATSGQMRMWFNGINVYSKIHTYKGEPLTKSGPLVWGREGAGTQYVFVGKMACMSIFDHELSESEVKTLSIIGTDTESGQITADRIAAGCVETRHLTADAIVGKTFQTASNTGTSNAAGVRFNSSGIQGFNGSAKTFDLSTNGKLTCSDVDLTGKITASSGKIGAFDISSNGAISYEGSSFAPTDGVIKIKNTSTNSYSWLNYGYLKFEGGTGLTSIERARIIVAYGGEVYISPVDMGSSYDNALIRSIPTATSKYGLYVAGKARINTTDYGSDEKTKKDFQDVSTLDKLKKLRVCAWRFDEEKLVEKDNAFIDAENIKIEAENKTIDAENAEIEKENENRKNRKDGKTVELLPLKEHKKLREHRIADKNANHPLNIGCMAGEFNKAFGTNDGSEDCLSVTDTIGVCMRAIQELAEQFDNAVLEIKELKAKLKIQQDEKLDVEQKEPTSKENLQVENNDTEPITEPVGNSEQLKDGGESEEKK